MITSQKPHERELATPSNLHAPHGPQERLAAGQDDFAAVLQNLAEEARILIDAHYASIRIARDENWVQIISAISLSEKFASWSEAKTTVDGFGDVLLFPIPKPLRLTSAEMLTHPAWKPSDQTTRQRPPMRGLLAVPLFDRQGWNFGLIDLTDKREGDFSADDERRLVQLAKIAALAIENAMLFRAVERVSPTADATSGVTALHQEIGKVLARAGDVRGTLQSAADVLASHFDNALARIWVEQNGVLELCASSDGASFTDDLYARVPIGHYRVGLIGQRRLSQLKPALPEEVDELEKSWAQRSGLTPFAGVPLLADDEVEGVLAFYQREPIGGDVLSELAAVASALALYVKSNRSNLPFLGSGVPIAFAAPTPTGAEHAVITTDLAGLIVDWSSGAEHLFGYPRRAALGQPIAMLIPPDRVREHQEAMEKVSRDETVSHPETVRLRQGGQRIDVSLTTSALHDPAGNPRGAVTVAHDIVAGKRLGQQYEQAQRMGVFGQLAGGIAHDFNNLITVIMGYSEILISGNHAGDSSRGLLKEIHKAAGRADTLTRQLLAFSRKQPMEMKVIDLNTVVSDTEKMLRRLIGEDILMTTILFPNLWSIEIDPGQMQQVILNLAVNARDAMPQGGHLTIETDNVTVDKSATPGQRPLRTGNYVRLSISDTGVGMNAAIQARIFEPLFTTKSPGKGTGLGLTTVKNIVQQGGGHIEVHSEPGRGATFKVYLPQVETCQAAAKPQSDLHLIPRGNETVLLVEDEDSVRVLARHVLEACGYTVLEACNGAEALRLADAYQGVIHLLVSDVVMPQLSGRALADRLLLSKPDLKILFLSGYTSDAMVRHGVLESDFAFLQKPFTTGALGQKVRLVLD